MGTIVDKLTKLLATKADIKAAIVEKGQPVLDSDIFASYGDKIRAIVSGGEPVLQNKTVTPTGKELIVMADNDVYLYNGIELPDINTVWTDKTTYPYAYYISLDAGRTLLWLSEGQLSVDAVNREMWNVGDARFYFALYELVDGSWSYVERSYLPNGGRITFSEMHWCNVHVFTTDGSVYLVGSEPALGYDGLSSVTIEGDPDLVPENIAKDVTIYGVTGTLEAESGSEILDTTAIDYSAWDSGSFRETLETGDILTYAVEFDASSQPTKITAPDGTVTTVEWGES